MPIIISLVTMSIVYSAIFNKDFNKENFEKAVPFLVLLGFASILILFLSCV